MMPLASHASIFMARFDEMRATAELPPIESPGTLFRHVAADTRGAAQEPGAQQAFRFLVIDQATPGPLFGSVEPPPPPAEPIVITRRYAGRSDPHST